MQWWWKSWRGPMPRGAAARCAGVLFVGLGCAASALAQPGSGVGAAGRQAAASGPADAGTPAPVVSTGQRSLDLLLRAQLPAASGSAAASAPAAAASAAVVPATPAATVEAPAPTMRESLQREAAEFAAAQKQAEAQPEGEPLPTPMRDDQSRREQTADHEALRSAVDKLGLRSTLWWLRENRDWLFTLIVLGVAAGLAVTAWRRSRGVLADHRRRKRQERRRAERALAEQAAAPVPSRSSHRTGESARRRDPAAAVDAASHHRSDGSRRRRSHRSSAALRPHRATR